MSYRTEKREKSRNTEGKPTILKGIASGNLEGVRGSLFRRALQTHRAPIPRLQNQSRGHRRLPKKKIHYTNENQVSMVSINYTNPHAPSFPFSITLGHSCSGYHHSFQARIEHHHRHHYCHHWRHKASSQRQETRHEWQITRHRHARHMHVIGCGIVKTLFSIAAGPLESQRKVHHHRHPLSF